MIIEINRVAAETIKSASLEAENRVNAARDKALSRIQEISLINWSQQVIARDILATGAPSQMSTFGARAVAVVRAAQ